MKFVRCAAGLACWTAMASFAIAHPGHGVENSDTASHYLLEPVHALPIVGIIAGLLIAGGVWRMLRNRKRSAESQSS